MNPTGSYQKLKQGFSLICRLVNAAGGLVLLAIMVLITTDVIMRSLFDMPIDGVYEVVELMMACTVSMGFAFAGIQGAHVTVDFLADKLPMGIQRILDYLNHLLSAALFAAICWKSIEQALETQEYETTTVLLEWELYPYYLVLAVCTGLLSLVYLFFFADSLKKEYA